MNNEFNKGIDYAFDYIEKHLIGHVIGYGLQGVVTEKMLKELRKKIHRRCDVCVGQNPCENAWCSTKDKDE